MHLKMIAAAVLFGVLVPGFALTASPEQQQGTRTPGQMTEAHVWIDNQGREEAIPVDLRDVHFDRPLRVQVVNNEPQYGPSNPVQVRSVRVLWDYRTLTVAPADNVAEKLNPLGAVGWEAVNVLSQNAEGTTLLLKRQR
jgi:hypothetical protein